jgi:hypothetical protein
MRQLSQKLMAALAGLEVQTLKQAEVNLSDTLPNMTGAERKAALIAEQLKVLGVEVDYAHTRLRAQLLAQLDTGDLWRFHPSSPNDFRELVQKQGVSKSEASDLIAWEKHIYPYLEQAFNLAPFMVWQMLSKTKRRRLTPYLRHLLDENHETYSDKVLNSIVAFEKQVLAETLKKAAEQWETDYAAAKKAGVPVVPEWAEIGEALLAGEDLTTEQESTLVDAYTTEFWPDFDWTKEVVRKILNVAETSSTSDIEHQLSPERTPAIEGLVIRHPLKLIDAEGVVTNSMRFQVVMTLSFDQLRMFQRRMPDRLDLFYIDGAPIEERKETQ